MGLDEEGKGRRCGGHIVEGRKILEKEEEEEEEESTWGCSKCGMVIRKEDILSLENRYDTQNKL